MSKKKKYRLPVRILCIAAAVLAVVLILVMENGRGYMFQDLEAGQIERVEYAYDLGVPGPEGSGKGQMDPRRIPAFVDFLKKVRLGGAVSDGESAYSGASSTYTLVMKDGSRRKLDPGEYFGVDGTYYKFINFNDLWDEFVEWNSSM
jgi:cytochrome c-type biogenesis protein CcmE